MRCVYIHIHTGARLKPLARMFLQRVPAGGSLKVSPVYISLSVYGSSRGIGELIVAFLNFVLSLSL